MARLTARKHIRLFITRVITVAAIVGVASGCATAGGAGGDGENRRTRPADCVITDTGGSDVVIENCIVEMGPSGTPRNVRLPLYETHTKTPVGELTYPLTFEVQSSQGDGLVIRLSGTSLDRPEGEPPPETPEVGEEVEPETGPVAPVPDSDDETEETPESSGDSDGSSGEAE